MSSTKVTAGGGGGSGTVSSRRLESLSPPPSSPSLLDELRSFDKGGLFDLGHPLLNRIAHSFITAAGIGAVQAVSREAYLTAVEGAGIDSGSRDASASKHRHHFPGLRGETSRKSVEALVCNRVFTDLFLEYFSWYDYVHEKQTCRTNHDGPALCLVILEIIKCSFTRQLELNFEGLAAGMYSGLTYGLKEVRGYHDWKNSAIAGALAGVTVALASDATTHEQVVQSAITGAALATAANLLTGVF